MSWPVMALCALSAHPALRESHRNRALLLRLANKADDSGGGIRYSVPTIADLMAGGAPSTGDAFADLKTRDARIRKTREALAELHTSGLCEPTGETYGPKGQEVIVRRILIAALALFTDPIEAGRWLTEEKFPGLAFMSAPLPSEGTPCRSTAPLPVEDTGASVGQGTPAGEGHPTPAAERQGTPAGEGHPILSSTVHETEPQTEKRADARSESAPILGPEVEAMNAATALRNQVALGKRSGALPVRRSIPVEPAPVAPAPLALEPDPTPEPEPRKASPGEARVAAAVETLLAEIGTDGQPERTLKLWRAKLHSRISDDGVGEEAVSKRVETIRAAWGNLQRSTWHVEKGCATRGHLYKITLRSGSELDAMASKRVDGAKPWAPRQARPWAAVGSAQLSPPAPDPVADAEHAERMAALDRIEREHLEEQERKALAEARAQEAAKPKPPPPSAPVKAPTEAGRGAFARMGDVLSLNGLATGQRGR